MTPEQERLAAILIPEATARLKEVREAEDFRFVHYTTAETAMKIIRDRGVWMRNAFTMNDYSEVRYGSSCFFYAWHSEAGNAMRDAMSKLHPDLLDLFNEDYFANFTNNLQTETYLTSFCAHHGPKADAYGRLSMWRAYGGDSGVALVVRKDAFISERGQAALFSSPVSYWEKERVAEEMLRVAGLITSDLDAFQGLDLQRLFDTFTLVFMAAVLCVKHPAFDEEEEWRIFYNSKLPLSRLLERRVEVVRGVPQVLYRLKFRGANDPDNGEVNLPEVFDRFIIGPSAFPYPIYTALNDALLEVGIPDTGRQIFSTNIPLRR